MRQTDNHFDSEDMFADTRMSFGDHLEELRTHLWRAIVGFLIAMITCLFISKPILSWFIIRPVETQLQIFYDEQHQKRIEEALSATTSDQKKKANEPRYVELQISVQQLKQALAGEPVRPLEDPGKLMESDWAPFTMRIANPIPFAVATDEAARLLGPRPTMKTFGITEAFMVYFKISLACGLVFGSPWIFYQIWTFIAAGLYPREKRYVHVYLPFSVALFWAGVFTCQFMVLPRVISALLWFNSFIGVEPDLRLNEWLGFAILFPVIFGLSFQTPLVMLMLERIGIFTVETYRTKRKIAFFIMCVVAAFGPTIDAYSMIFQWVALCLLYQLGIWLCVWMPKRQVSKFDVPESEEMIEV